MNYRSPLHFFTAASLLCSLILCTANNPPVSGPSTTQGNPQVVAVVLDKQKAPVSGVVITVFLIPKAPDSTDIPQQAVQVLHGVTNDSGVFTIYSLETGTYTFLANDFTGKRRASSSLITISNSDTATASDTMQLDVAGEINGIVMREPGGSNPQMQNNQLQHGGIMVIIQELGISANTPTTGTFKFTDIPTGNYTIFYYASNGYYSTKQVVNVIAGTAVVADTVRLRPYPTLSAPRNFSLRFDTLTNVVYLSWSAVKYDLLRWYAVERFTSHGISDTIFTSTDTTAADTLTTIVSGTMFEYVVRAVDQAYNRSANSGPLRVVVP